MNTPNSPTAGSTENSQTYTILIVDDEPYILERLGDDLTLAGFSVITAKSAEDGLAVLEKTQAELVISDQKMSGGMGGTAFLCKVRELYPHTVTMILSAYTESNY